MPIYLEIDLLSEGNPRLEVCRIDEVSAAVTHGVAACVSLPESATLRALEEALTSPRVRELIATMRAHTQVWFEPLLKEWVGCMDETARKAREALEELLLQRAEEEETRYWVDTQ